MQETILRDLSLVFLTLSLVASLPKFKISWWLIFISAILIITHTVGVVFG